MASAIQSATQGQQQQQEQGLLELLLPPQLRQEGKSHDAFSCLPDELFAHILLLVASNGNDFMRTGSNGQDLPDDDEIMRQKIKEALTAPDLASSNDDRREEDTDRSNAPIVAAEHAAGAGFAVSLGSRSSAKPTQPLVVFDHALVAKQWLRVARSVHPAIIVRSNRSICSGQLESALRYIPSDRSAPCSASFPNLRHLHLGVDAVRGNMVSGQLFHAIAVRCGPSLTHLTLQADSSKRGFHCNFYNSEFDDNISIIFSNCTRLVDLEVSLPMKMLGGRRMGEILASISSLQQLTRLTVSLPHVVGLAYKIWSLQSLRRLNGDGRFLGSLPDSIGSLSSLEEFKLGRSLVSHLPTGFGQLKELRSLILESVEKLVELPDAVCQLPALSRLQLHSCKIFLGLPENIGQLRQLKSLQLFEMDQVFLLPESLCELPNLTDLDVRNCQSIVALPESLPSILSLQRLIIHEGKSMPLLPDSIGQLINIQELDLESLDLVALPDSLSHLSSLTRLTLRDCTRLEHLPESVSAMQSLAAVGLHGCGIAQLPGDFELLQNLRLLELSQLRNFQALPGTFGQLQQLKELRIAECSSLLVLPASLTLLTRLEYLSIKACEQLRELPEGMGNMACLRHVQFCPEPVT